MRATLNVCYNNHHYQVGAVSHAAQTGPRWRWGSRCQSLWTSAGSSPQSSPPVWSCCGSWAGLLWKLGGNHLSFRAQPARHTRGWKSRDRRQPGSRKLAQEPAVASVCVPALRARLLPDLRSWRRVGLPEVSSFGLRVSASASLDPRPQPRAVSPQKDRRVIGAVLGDRAEASACEALLADCCRNPPS